MVDRIPVMVLPELLRGLVYQHGWSPVIAAQQAGTSPIAIENWLSRLTPAAQTWLRLMHTFGCRVIIARGQDAWKILAPPVSKPQRDRSLQAWRRKRFLHYVHAIAVQNKALKKSEREKRAHQYVASEEQRIINEIDAAKVRMQTTMLAGELPGMRLAIQAFVDAAHITVDHLVFASGVNYDATALILKTSDDGRLRPLRGILAALDARLEIHLPSGSRVVIARLVTESSPQQSEQKTKNSHKKTKVSRHTKTTRHASQIRSTIDHHLILQYFDAGMPITKIATRAGISRQRVHAIAKANGRILRREVAREARIKMAQSLLF